MELSQFTIEKLVKVINGEQINGKQITPYKSGPNLIELFSNYGFRDIYGKGFKSRKDYTKEKLLKINKTKNMEKFINDLVHSQQYIDTDYNVEEIVEYLNKLIKYDGYKLEKNEGEYIVIGEGLLPDEKVEIKPVFENIQEEIIEEIRKAKYTIWIAVAWFTDDKLLQELIEKQKQGVNVQVIVCNDETTARYGLKYEDYFETYKINTFGAFDNNIFHDKFCVIDLKTVIHGSYNWTNKAQYNEESIDTIRSREHAEKYADRFKELKMMNK